MPSSEDQIAALPFRVYANETKIGQLDGAVTSLQQTTSRHSEAISAQAVTLAAHDEKLSSQHEDIVENKTDLALVAASVVELGKQVAASSSRVAWTLTGFAFTIAAATLTLVLTHAPS